MWLIVAQARDDRHVVSAHSEEEEEKQEQEQVQKQKKQQVQQEQQEQQQQQQQQQQHNNFPYPTHIPATIWDVPFGVDPSCWGLQRVKRLG